MIMGINVRKYQESDISGMNRVWNEVVDNGKRIIKNSMWREEWRIYEKQIMKIFK